MASELAGPSQARAWKLAAILFVGLFTVYLANGTEVDEGDALPSLKLPFAILTYHRLSFEPEWFPDLFDFRGHPPFVEKDDISFPTWAWTFGKKTIAEWALEGAIELKGPKYFLVQSPIRHTYVNVFGPVPGLALLPFVAPFYAFDRDVHRKGTLRAKIGKLAAATMVAGTATLLFLIAERFLARRRALLLALVYALGTCAWAISSQNIWQQTVNQLLLAGGAYCLLGRTGPPALIRAGLLFGTATACRSTGVFVLAAVALDLFSTRRRALVPFLLAALPPLIAIGVYNTWYFGNPFTFAQSVGGHRVAMEKTGSPSLFQTPIWYGALGLLASPSRGLLIFSPVLVPAFVGVARVFRDAAYRAFRPFTAAALLMMLLQCAWFDWWGGHTYGYRPWLDAVPYLVLSTIPIFDSLFATPLRRSAFAGAFGWSVLVQALGAWAYDRSWNVRNLYVVSLSEQETPRSYLEEEHARRLVAEAGATYLGRTPCDVDLPRCRYRLWSLSDSIIPYHLLHLSKTHRGRLQGSFLHFIVPPADDL